MSWKPQNRARWVAAWACLIALALMYAPLAGAFVLAQSGDCCAGGYCKIPAHHHKKTSPSTDQEMPASPPEAACDHEHAGLTQCTMSCCQDTTQPALAPVAFVVPAASVVPQPGESMRTAATISAVEILRLARPLSPPPRSGSALL